ncbi:TraR/DksA family transcriptional regulator [Candidatus Parcubacteria bacterium]|nr:TraR/DksA family transcriptional regulator [Candidatus Parcubacteria bacterium]
MLDPQTISQFKVRLETERTRIREELKTIAKEVPRGAGDFDQTYPEFGNDVDPDEGADEVEEFTNILPLEKRLEERLALIEKALKKIEQGTYGTCERCANPIEQSRLEAIPEATACLKCK